MPNFRARLLSQTEWQLSEHPNFESRIVLQYYKEKDLQLVVGVYKVDTTSAILIRPEDLLGEVAFLSLNELAGANKVAREELRCDQHTVL